MKLAVAFVVLSTLAIPSRTAGQTNDPDQTAPAGSPTSAPPQAPTASSVPQPSTTVDRPVSWKLLLPNLISDQERIWSFPTRLVQGQSWIPTAAVLGTTAGLLALDPAEDAYFHRTPTFQTFNNIFTGNVTVIGTIAAPTSLYVVGLFRKDAKLVYADKETREIQRITLKTVEIPSDFTVKDVELRLDYKPTDISGHIYTLPFNYELDSVSIHGQSKNEADFKLYQVYGADTTITFQDTGPTPDDQLKEQPAQGAKPPVKKQQ